ncbi:hypothetical protein [Glutamicibacter ardleyensis]|uniref:hypothetical protein n=1 Tax=Glutamicibacter ardleyensis TaxID=225894 RepID=UPI003FCF421C
MSTHRNIPDKQEQEAELAADLEATWQEESPSTARTTKFADEVDGELGTREGV